MKTYYVLDRETPPEDAEAWEEAIKIEAWSAEDAARDWAAGLDDRHDGMRACCLVSEKPTGEDAVPIEVTIVITWSYIAKIKTRR